MATVTLGDENERYLTAALREVLQSLDARRVDHSWGVAGSVALETWKFEIDGVPLIVESDNWTGFELSGNDALVERVVALVRSRCAALIAADA